MEEKKSPRAPQSEMQQNMDAEQRRTDERRADACRGYTYVSTVGWICRREKSRRKDRDGTAST